MRSFLPVFTLVTLAAGCVEPTPEETGETASMRATAIRAVR